MESGLGRGQGPQADHGGGVVTWPLCAAVSCGLFGIWGKHGLASLAAGAPPHSFMVVLAWHLLLAGRTSPLVVRHDTCVSGETPYYTGRLSISHL